MAVRVPGPKAVWSVWRINQAAKRLLESQTRLLWVAGEVGSWTKSRSGHRYFTLIDERAELRCVLFADDAWRLPMEPERGASVRVFGQLTIYEARGSFQLRAKRIEAEGGEGLWQIAFDRLRSLLDSEGLLDPARKRRLPAHPQTVAVVTSPAGAAVHDVLSVVGRRAPWVRVLVSPTVVQGEAAAEQIARAMKRATEHDPAVILLCRGGGGPEDLFAFNQEPVARAIVESPVPVLTGIGHEVDRTIADLVADRAAPTPSAAAELAVSHAGDTLSQLTATGTVLRECLRDVARSRRQLFRERSLELERAGTKMIDGLRGRVAGTRSEMENAVHGVTARRRRELSESAALLDSISPLATLARGYSVARDAHGRVLSRRADFPADFRFSLRVTDGEVACRASGDAL